MTLASPGLEANPNRLPSRAIFWNRPTRSYKSAVTLAGVISVALDCAADTAETAAVRSKTLIMNLLCVMGYAFAGSVIHGTWICLVHTLVSEQDYIPNLFCELTSGLRHDLRRLAF